MIKIAVSFTMRTIKPTSPISVDAVYAFPLCFFILSLLNVQFQYLIFYCGTDPRIDLFVHYLVTYI